MTHATARNIVSQLGDLYMDFTHPATPERAEFVKYRQATNDRADAFVEALLREYASGVVREVKALHRPRTVYANESHCERQRHEVDHSLGRHIEDWTGSWVCLDMPLACPTAAAVETWTA